MINLKLCKNSEDFKKFKHIIDEHHSYVKHKRTPTRRLDFLVYENDSKNLIGAVGINSAVLNLGLRDKILKLNNKNKGKRLLNIANNYRFALIRENITIQNAGSQTLKALRETGAKVWKRKYGNKLIGIETFVKPPWTGSVYKADNWFSLGQTKGFEIKRLPLKLIEKFHHKNEIRKFKKKYNTDRLFYDKKVEPKLIFFKPLEPKWNNVFREYMTNPA